MQLMNIFQKNYDMLLDIFNPEGWLEITYPLISFFLLWITIAVLQFLCSSTESLQNNLMSIDGSRAILCTSLPQLFEQIC